MRSRAHPLQAGGAGCGADAAVDVLLQLREARSESAHARLRAKQTEIASLQREIEEIQSRRSRVTEESKVEVLEARLLMDGLTRELWARKREMEGLREESVALLKEYMDLRGQCDSVRALRDRRLQDEDYVRERRAEAAASDAAATRTVRGPTTERGRP
jgi:hypothetical protein